MFDLSCVDWADRLRAGLPLVPDTLPLFREEAERAVKVFNRLRLPDVPGTPLLRDAAGDWFRDIVRALFGSWDAAANERYIREVFALVPKKNSKTSYGAAMMVVAMLLSTRPNAEYLLIAPTQQIALLAFAQAVGMIDIDPELRKRCRIQEHIKTITYKSTGAFLRVKSFDPKVVTGTKAAGVLLDELHVIAESHDADRVIGQLRGGLISQPEGFLIIITTQSERPPAGVFRNELAKARSVRDGKLKTRTLPVLYEFPPGVDWRDRTQWPMVIPNNGRSISVERLAEEFDAADASGPEELRRWASQHLNVEIGVGMLSDGWPGAAYWPAQGLPEGLTLDELLDRSEVVTIGIDGGGLDDMLGLCVLGRERGTGHWLAWCHAWIHDIAIQRRKSEAQRYRDFIAAGDLTLVADEGAPDVNEVADLCLKVRNSGLLARIGVDPIGIAAVLQALSDRGINANPSSAASLVVGVPQNWRMTGAIKATERALAEGAMWHSGSGLMAWCAGNARVVAKGNGIAIEKSASGFAKIDPLIACIGAVMLMSTEVAAISNVNVNDWIR